MLQGEKDTACQHVDVELDIEDKVNIWCKKNLNSKLHKNIWSYRKDAISGDLKVQL